MNIRKTNIIGPTRRPNIIVTGSLKAKLPPDLKSVWPDLIHLDPVYINKGFSSMPRKPESLHVVVFKNEFSVLGLNVNFRDLPVSEKFRTVYFHQMYGVPEWAAFNDRKMPSHQLLASKIYFHLGPKGYLIFRDFASNTQGFRDCLQKIGLEPFSDHIELDGMVSDDEITHIFRKD